MTLVVALILLMMGSAFFSATETAFSSLNKPRLKNMAAEGNKKAKLAYKLAENYDELISSTLVGNNVVNIAATTIGTLLFVGWLGSNGATVSTIFMTVITLVFGEITPKSLAKECPEKFAITVAPIINILITVLKPVNFLLIKLKSSVGKLLKVSGTTNGITENELLTIVDEAEQVGGLDSNESELIHNVIEFNDLQATSLHRVLMLQQLISQRQTKKLRMCSRHLVIPESLYTKIRLMILSVSCTRKISITMWQELQSQSRRS